MSSAGLFFHLTKRCRPLTMWWTVSGGTISLVYLENKVTHVMSKIFWIYCLKRRYWVSVRGSSMTAPLIPQSHAVVSICNHFLWYCHTFSCRDFWLGFWRSKWTLVELLGHDVGGEYQCYWDVRFRIRIACCIQVAVCQLLPQFWEMVVVHYCSIQVHC